MAGRCDECGFDWDATGPAEAIDALRAFGRRYTAPLTRFLPGEDADGVLRSRPDADTWSALEYACHVRDVFDVYDERVRRVLVEDRPEIPWMRRDELPTERRYNEQVPTEVAAALTANGERLATTLEGVEAVQWDRCGVREGEELSLRWMAVNTAHEGSHHLLDIGRVLRAVRAK